MAELQHKNIVDPNIHEPKGIKYAAAGTAYVADGNGGGQWEEILVPGSIGITPSVLYSCSKSVSYPSTVLTGAILPVSWNIRSSYSWGSPRINNNGSFLEVSKSGVYSLTLKLSMTVTSSYSNASLTLTKTSSGLTPINSYFLPTIGTADENTPVYSNASLCTRLIAGQGIGLWIDGEYNELDFVSDFSVSCDIQLTRLSDG